MPTRLEIVTPEEKIFSDDVDSVLVPGIMGEMGVLPMHAPLVTTLRPGELNYKKDGVTTELAVGEGIVEVTQTSVSVLTDLAVADAQIDEAAVEAALKRAQDALTGEGDHTPEEVAAVQAAIQKSMAQLKLKRKRRRV